MIIKTPLVFYLAVRLFTVERVIAFNPLKAMRINYSFNFNALKKPNMELEYLFYLAIAFLRLLILLLLLG